MSIDIQVKLNYEVQSLYAGYACTAIMLAGMILMGFIPPHSPAFTAETIAGLYAEQTGTKVGGLILLMFASALYLPFSVGIGFQMIRIEGSRPLLAVTQMLLGLATAMLLLLAEIFWAAALFRAGRDPQLIVLMSDLGWLTFLWPFPFALLQYLTVGICILSDRRPKTYLPRWLGFFSIWTAISLIFGALIPAFRQGPFAWNGLFGFWIPAAFFFLWIVLACGVMSRAARQDAASFKASEI